VHHNFLVRDRVENIAYVERPLHIVGARIIVVTKVTSVLCMRNPTSQLSSLLREHLLMTVDHKILKYDGRPFNPRELSQRIREVV